MYLIPDKQYQEINNKNTKPISSDEKNCINNVHHTKIEDGGIQKIVNICDKTNSNNTHETENKHEKTTTHQDMDNFSDSNQIEETENEQYIIKPETDNQQLDTINENENENTPCLLYTSPSPRDKRQSRMPSSA